jgi:phosphate transport system substrate-binding protein
MKKLICVILTLVMVLSLAACGGKETASVSTDGSTSMQKVINALGEAFMEDTGANFTYNATGSGTGIKAVKDGTCDIGHCHTAATLPFCRPLIWQNMFSKT